MRRAGVLVCAVVLSVGAGSADAQADSLTVRLRQAIAQYDRGDRASAMREFTRFIDIYNAAADRLTSQELVAVATACTYLGIENPQLFRDALKGFDRAIAKDPSNLDARVKLAELFLDKYNGADAKRTLSAALERDSSYVPALVLEARRRSFDGERGADALLARALVLQPDNVQARVLRAHFLADAEDFARAATEVERVLRANANDADALAFSAALRFAARDTAGYATIARQFTWSYPRSAGVEIAVAELLARLRQYGAAAAAARQGVEREPTNWRAHALLGTNLLRLGDVTAARKSLETAFAGDPFDVWTKNTLDLLDTFGEYDELNTPRFRFMVNKAESALLPLYLGDLAERAFTTFAAKYGFTPSSPLRVEIYRSHADFSVRTVGLAGLGALGVSFGNTVAFDSPAAKDAGAFNWGSTAWHELAHTFTLGASDQRVPRWLSEGLSVYEERLARRGWGQQVTPGFLEAYKKGRLVPPSRLNDGFIRPAYPQQVLFSYYEASLLCELIARDFGEKAFIDMLAAYRAGFNTEQVVWRVLRLDMPALDNRFDAYVRERFGAVLPVLDAYHQRLDSARSLLQQGGVGDAARALAILERARASFPEYAGAESAYPLLARAFLDAGNRVRAAEVLSAMMSLGEASHDAHVSLADLLLQHGDTSRAAEILEGAMFVNPYNIADHETLAALYTRLGNKARTVRERLAAVALDPVDRAQALYLLAVAYRDAGDSANARHAVIRSLEEAPHFERAQELLLALHEGKSP